MKKQFAVDYNNVLDWSQTVNLQTEEFITQTSYDALNRPITITQPDNTVVSHIYNKGGLLEQVLHGTVTYISNINYNEKGQREDVYYGNSTKTRYYYDTKTFRLKRLLTTRNSGTDILQDIHYTFDAVGNIVQQKDNAQQIFYFDNQVIAPNSTYTYDPLYRLINATGRELSSLASPTNEDFANNIGVPNPAANAMQNYNHTYVFDELGNMQSDNWKDYVYDTATNRLLKHDPDQTLDDYTYDNHGNMLTMPHLTSTVWDYSDRLQSAGNGTFTSYYNYDMGGNRSRKVVIKSNIREERYYIGDYEIYRKFVNEVLDTERSTVHIMDDRDRFAMIETETGNTPVVRYQYNNHLGSACLELDQTAQIISYEEYHPFGTTSYRSGRTETEVSLKRYKYVGKERDEETGLYYYGARYYAAWICRFVSVDPLQFEYPYYTPYQYAGNKPISYIDLDGLEEWKVDNQQITTTYFNYSNEVQEYSFTQYSGTVYGPYKDQNAVNQAISSGRATIYNFLFASQTISKSFMGFNGCMTNICTTTTVGYYQQYNFGGINLLMNGIEDSSNHGFVSSNTEFESFHNGRSTGSGACYSTDVAGALVESFIREPMQVGLEELGMSENAAFWTSQGLTIAGMIVFGKVSNSVAAKTSTPLWTSTSKLSSVKNAFGHWKKHAAEFPEFVNAKQYVEGAKNFLHNSPAGTLIKTRANGDILKYHPGTNTFGVMDASGVPRTMFRPTDGMKYWLGQ